MTRLLTDETTAGETFAWHRADSPECEATHLSWHADGFGCRACGWMALDPDADAAKGRRRG